MIQQQIDIISKSDINELIANSVNESKTLEYKQELPGNSDKDRFERLRVGATTGMGMSF